ncbi:MAG: oligosaccharide repeat unit polymerase [Phycisphaeraceae bacterium]|nr:MAG: oligosaccharide repeat unit polymerase [Phycisphaeraceae bacterium]
MTVAVATYLLFLSLLLGLLMMRDHIKGRVELLSIRNFGLAGFIIFQLTSASLALYREYQPLYPLTDTAGTAVKYAAFCTVFLIVALVVYRLGPGVSKLVRLVPTSRAVPNEPFMWLVAAILAFMALALRTMVRVPLVAVLADYVGTAFAAIACGLAGWIWAKRFLNPAAATYAMLIFLACSASVILGSFGRRGLVAVGAGMLWGMYYSRWRFNDPKRMLVQLSLVAAVPIVALALFTSVRSSREHDRGVGEHVSAITSGGSLKAGLEMLLDGQGTGSVSMWLSEQYPDNYAYRWFHTPKYFVVFPVPRALWRGKPDALSERIATMANRSGVDRSRLKVGPGIIGHAAAEGGWIAVVFYGILAGLVLRFFDEIVRQSPYSPFVVLPVGAALGQIIGLSRGETAPFLFNYVFGVFGSYFTLIMVAKFVERIGLARPGDGSEQAYADSDEYEQWEGYGDETQDSSGYGDERQAG